MIRDLDDRFDRFDTTVRRVMRRIAVPTLRVSVGIVFVWFGALKVFDVSPVADLVARTVYWFEPTWVVEILGTVEIVVGICLIFGALLRLALFAFVAQMLGTFLVFVILPDVAFRDGNPMLLTVEGEFVVKNLVLLSAGLVVGANVLPRSRSPIVGAHTRRSSMR
jgi:uncharacterized membrane protein YkgB